MHINMPEPDFSSSRRAKSNFQLAIKLAAGFVALMWLVFTADHIGGLELSRFGLYPRTISGLIGLIMTPLVHSGLPHITNNSIPMLVGGTALLYLYPNCSVRVLPYLYAGTSLLAWTFARPSFHIGASGMVYGILTFVFVSGLLRRDLRSVGVSLLLWFLYGSMAWGVLPIRQGMSWELHLSGAVIGFAMAVVYRRWDRIPVKRYDWEDDEEVPEWYLRAEEERLDEADQD